MKAGRGRTKIFDEDAVVLKFKVPRSVHTWLSSQGKSTLRSASLYARDVLLAAIDRTRKSA